MAVLEPTRLQYPTRTLQAFGRIEAKAEVVAKVAAFTPPQVASAMQDPRITTLARAMGDPAYHFPSGSKVNLTWDKDGEIIATGLTIENRFWSISDIVKLGLINERGLGSGTVIQPSPWCSRQSLPITSGRTTPPRWLVGRTCNQEGRWRGEIPPALP